MIVHLKSHFRRDEENVKQHLLGPRDQFLQKSEFSDPGQGETIDELELKASGNAGKKK